MTSTSNTTPDKNIDKESSMTTDNRIKTGVDLRAKTLFVESCFTAGRISKLESVIKEWDLDDQAAVQSANYFGKGRWEYRDSFIEGMWMPGGNYEFLAKTDLHERQFVRFSQATTWLDGVEAGVEECNELNRKQAQ